MAFTVKEFHDLIRLLEKKEEWRQELRRILLTEDILSLPSLVSSIAEDLKILTDRVNSLTEQMQILTERVDALTARVDALVEQMQSLTERVNLLTARVDALTARVDALTEQMQILTMKVDALTEQIKLLTADVNYLIQWQKGEAGRREGERYELQTVKRAPLLFKGGKGGSTDSPIVQSRLSEWLSLIEDNADLLDPEDDPTLADMIWWKGDKVMIVEVSLKVNGKDINRAIKRAETLKKIGVNSVGVVIGEDWANLEVRELAKEKGILWFVGGIPSEEFVALRKTKI